MGNLGFPSGSNGKESSYSAVDLGLIPGSGRSPREGRDNPLQYSCLEYSIDRGVWQAILHGFAKSWTQLKQLRTHACIYLLIPFPYLVPPTTRPL